MGQNSTNEATVKRNARGRARLNLPPRPVLWGEGQMFGFFRF